MSSALEKKGTKKIGEVTEGEYVQIQGKIFPAGEIIKAPLTGRECVYYHVKIEQLVTKLYSPGLIHSRFGAHIPEWKTVSEDEMMADVVITDGKDFAFVDCNHPLTYLVPDDDFVSVEDSAPDVQRFIKKRMEKRPDFLDIALQTRYREGILETDEMCTIKGYGHWEDPKKLKLQLPVDRILVIREKEGEGVYISDDPVLVKTN